MATKTLTSTTGRFNGDVSTRGSATYTITYPNESIVIKDSTFTVDNLLPTAMTAQLTWWSYGTKGESRVGFYFPTKSYSNAYVMFEYSYGNWANGATKTLTRGTPHSATFNTADFFNSTNPTQRTYNLTYAIEPLVNYGLAEYMWSRGTDGDVMNDYYNQGWTTVSLGQTLVLDAPPTFDTLDASDQPSVYLYFDTNDVYAGITTASIKVANLSAKYGGNIVSATLNIGNQSVSRSDNGVLSILLDSVGTFVPTVVVTDSRGQTSHIMLDAVTVNGYNAPRVSFSADRTLATGVRDDEGTYCVISPTLVFADAIATAQAPTVTVTDENGVTTTPTVSWYSTRSSSGVLSGSVTWANLSSGDTVYGLISGFGTQESYQITVTPRDSEGVGTPITQTLATAFYTVDFLAGGHGVAFGQPASQNGFFCNMDAYFADNNSVMRALFDFIHPVGSYYETSDTAFDPNTTWGGTWELETQGQVHISAGANYSVAGALTNTTDGGASTVTLNVNQIPAHGHIPNNWVVVTNKDYVSYGDKILTGSAGSFSAKANASPNADQYISNNTGGGQAHNNMQPYIVVKRWHRTA